MYGNQRGIHSTSSCCPCPPSRPIYSRTHEHNALNKKPCRHRLAGVSLPTLPYTQTSPSRCPAAHHRPPLPARSTAAAQHPMAPIAGTWLLRTCGTPENPFNLMPFVRYASKRKPCRQRPVGLLLPTLPYTWPLAPSIPPLATPAALPPTSAPWPY